MGLLDQIGSDFSEITAELGGIISLDGFPLSATLSRPEFAQEWGEGGYTPDCELVAKLLRSECPNGTPQIGAKVVADGKLYRVAKVGESPTSPILFLWLERSGVSL